jgi:hypothetical protein
LRILTGMPLPAPFWACLALFLAVGITCRKWPALSLWGAVCAFCAVGQALLRWLPSEHPIVLADSILFVLPSIVLARACGATERRALLVGLVVPVSVAFDFDPFVRSSMLTFGVALAQGSSALLGLRDEIQSDKPNLSRRIAIAIAAVGVLGIGFVDAWPNVAWTAVAAHAFACFIYLAHENRKK